MGAKSQIEWTDATWNPTAGCSRVSPGCKNCYAERIAGRFSGPGQPYEGLVTVTSRHPQTGAPTTGTRPKWNGVVRVVPKQLHIPLRWSRPRKVFVNSMSDLFHGALSDSDIETIFAIMSLTPHTYQILTKRHDEMLDWFSYPERKMNVYRRAHRIAGSFNTSRRRSRDRLPYLQASFWPLPNVWLGISAESQRNFDERWAALRQCPAAVRFVSYEPALGPLDLRKATMAHSVVPDWVIAGAESGPHRRAASLQWFRDVRDRCKRTGVAFFMKQLEVDGRISKDMSEFPSDLRIREFPR